MSILIIAVKQDGHEMTLELNRRICEQDNISLLSKFKLRRPNGWQFDDNLSEFGKKIVSKIFEREAVDSIDFNTSHRIKVHFGILFDAETEALKVIDAISAISHIENMENPGFHRAPSDRGEINFRLHLRIDDSSDREHIRSEVQKIPGVTAAFFRNNGYHFDVHCTGYHDVEAISMQTAEILAAYAGPQHENIDMISNGLDVEIVDLDAVVSS